ncbi:MAG: hypothetical protein U9Q07_10035, partial [Planctomycetota bacterium]|nr:hypothetical protein [Planctomycetota bacterium]
KETIVYLHKGFEQEQAAGTELELDNLSIPDGVVSVRFVHPNTGKSSTSRASVKNASLTLTLPEFYENLVIAIAGKQKTEYTKKREAILRRDSKSRKVPKIPPKGKRIRVIFDTDAKNEIDDV